MGIKGKKRRDRERSAREITLGVNNDNNDIENIEYFDDAPPFAGDSFQPKSFFSSKNMSQSERWRIEESELLAEMQESNRTRKGSHMNCRKRSRAEVERDNANRQILNENPLGKFSLAEVDYLAERDEEDSTGVKRNQRCSVATGGRIDHIMLDLRPELVQALQTEGFYRLTSIQDRAVPLALQGYDILGQAKTGSGKTLAFCIPLLNNCVTILKTMGVKRHPLLGLILTPTKELCVQIHSVIQSITQHFDKKIIEVRSQLITGGTKVTSERKVLLGGCSIVVGTPGRVMDHVKHCVGWDMSTLKYLVLDEADRMLADGFQRDLDAIIDAMPKSRQTFLFSATNSKSVRELARLSLSHTPIIINTKGNTPVFVDTNSPIEPPSYVSIRDGSDDDDNSGNKNSKGNTERDEEEGKGKRALKSDAEDIPSQLRQFCYIGKVEDRLRALYVFVRRVAKIAKVMIFYSTVASTIFHCQIMGSVGFHNEVLMLHGHMKHRQRVQTFEAFNSWTTGVLFCTDVAARGLDIPHVDWILQYDPPLDPTEYIHRVGRTARAGSVGNALIFLSEEEASFVKYLSRYGITMARLPMPKQLPNIQAKLEHVLQLDPIVAKSAISAFRAHVGAYQSHLLQQTFDIRRLNLDALAKAFALSVAPSVSLPKNTSEEKVEYIKGKLKSLNKRHKEALKNYHDTKTQKQWTEDGAFIGVKKPEIN